MRSYILLGLLAARTLSLGQTLAFEAASVKPSSADSNQADVQSRSGRLTMRNVTLKRCIRGAYYIPELSVVGGPKWIDDARFDIEAKAPGPAGDHDLMRSEEHTSELQSRRD